MEATALHGGCPVVHLDTGVDRRAGEWVAEFDRLREGSPIWWNEERGFWIITSGEYIREAFQNPQLFTSDSVRPTDPNPPYKLIPSNINPPQHVKYRQILNYAFGPAAMKRIAPRVRVHCAETLDAFAASGSADIIADFGGIYPTKVFLELVDLPWEDAPLFVGWIETIFDGIMSGRDVDAAVAAMAEIKAYFAEKIAARRAAGVGSVGDFLDHLLQAEIDGERLSDDDLLNIYNQLAMAGLDTVKSALGYTYLHLATHPEDQQRIVADPEVIPTAVEEVLRAFPLIMIGRKLSQDTVFHGAELREGQMVMLALPAAMRDPQLFERPDEVVLDREDNSHFSFGAGAHRCLGSHLARMELTVALEEWHRRIPSYDLACPADQIIERGGQLSLRSLPLTWKVHP